MSGPAPRWRPSSRVVVAGLGALTIALTLLGTVLNLFTRFSALQEVGFRWIGVASLGEPIALALAVVAVVGAVALVRGATGRWRWWAAWALLPVVVCAWLWWPILAGVVAPERAEGGNEFSVLVHNLWYEHEDPPRIAAAVAAQDADVVVLIEYTPEHAAAFGTPELLARYEHRWEQPLPRGAGIAVLSRLPFSEPELIDTTLTGLRTLLDVGAEEPVTLFAVHPVSPANIYSLPIWQDDMRTLTAAVAAAGPATVVAGDLNSSAGHRRFRHLLRVGELRDAADVAGAGYVPTWPLEGAFPAMLRLDHILVGEGVGVVDVEVVDGAGSDHRGVAAVLQVPRS